jgi:glutamyl-tRNA synthetase
MAITTVIRGDDHINNTPRQIMLYEALGFPVPRFAHVPMILGADKTRLSKRHGATSVIAYREMGFLPEALVNYLVRLGWSHGDDEIFSRDELVEKFSIESVGRSASVFNPDKLLWLNAHYIKTGDPVRLGEILQGHLAAIGITTDDGPALPAVVKTLQERARTMVEMAEGAKFYYQPDVAYDDKGEEKLREPAVPGVLEGLIALVEGVAPFGYQQLEEAVKGFCAERGVKLGQVGPVIRVALCGTTAAPGIYEVMEALGQAETLARLRRASRFIAG